MEFTLKATFSTSAKKMYKSWLSTQGHTKMTGGAAFVSDQIGDTFTAWDGYIRGKNVVLEPYSRIVQSWRSSNFKENEEDSQIELILNEVNGETELTLIHSNVPDGGEHYMEGWDEHYFQPMKNYFELID
jgi:activator of HSP90 ATPase